MRLQPPLDPRWPRAAVIGVVKGTMNGIQLEGGPATIKTIYCTMDSGDSDAVKQSDEKLQKLNGLSFYPRPPKPPIAEVKCVFSEGSVFEEQGIPTASVFLNKCTIVSIQ